MSQQKSNQNIAQNINQPINQPFNRNIIVIGASAGGVEALTKLVHHLPADLPAAIFVVLHISARGTSVLPQILSRAGSLTALHPTDRQAIQMGQIYVAPPDYHLGIESEQIRLWHGPLENGHRPAIDLLFRTAAEACGPRVIGVILSGLLDDGTAGLQTVKQQGGFAIVQDPQDALFNGMPNSAIQYVAVDSVLPLCEIPAALVEQVQKPVEISMTFSDDPKQDEAEIVRVEKAALEQGKHPGQASMLTCPDCGGVLWELGRDSLLRYRCHVGHVYSAESLVDSQAVAVETALWTAIRALEEKAALSRRMAAHAREQQRRLSEVHFTTQADEISQQADLIREIVAEKRAKPGVPNLAGSDGNSQTDAHPTGHS